MSTVEQVIDDVGQAALYYEAELNGYKALVKTYKGPNFDVRKYGAVFDGRDNQQALDRATAAAVKAGGGVLILPPGDALIHDWAIHPSVSVWGPGPGVCRLTVAAGAQACGIRSLARGQPVGSPTSSVNTQRQRFTGFLVNGNGNAQVNVCDNILFEDWHNDPQFGVYDTTNYSAGYIDDVMSVNASGVGVNQQAGRHRFFCIALHCVNNASNGIKLIADDSIIGDRSGFGANGAAAILASGFSGFMLRGSNIWSPSGTNRSDTDQGLNCVSLNGATIVGNVFNDSIRVKSTTKTQDRAVVIVGNEFRPDQGNLVANGTPSGTFTDYSNAWVIVDNAEQVVVQGNGFSCQFSQRWGFKNLFSINNAGKLFASFQASSDPNNCPWSDPTNQTPWFIDVAATSFIEVDFVDTYAHTRRINSIGLQLQQHDSDVYDAAYGLQIGNGIPNGFLPIKIKPDVKFTRGEAWDWGASGGSAMAQRLSCSQHGANTFAINRTNRHKEIFCAAGTIDTLTLALLQDGDPVPTSGKVIRIRFVQAVTTLTWSIGHPNPGSGNIVPVLRETLPATVAAGTVIELSWDDSNVGGIPYAWNRIL